MGHPDYKAAYEAARQKVVSLANATQPPKAQEYLRAQGLDDEQADAEEIIHVVLIRDDPHLDQEQRERQ